MAFNRPFWAILALALCLRLVWAWLAPQPGIGDPVHYYNVARNVAEGRGLVVDYLWHYHYPHTDITHPEDYWMPLPALYPAVMLMLFPDSLFAALLPSVLFGVAVVALAYGIAWSIGASEQVRWLAMLGVLCLSELMLNSARTDTTISYVFFVGVASVSFYHGMKRNTWAWLFLAGIGAGFAHLTRQDALLLAPAFVVAMGIWRVLGERVRWRWLAVIGLGWLLIVAPYLWRNYTLFGTLLSNGSGRTAFMTSFIDQFTYGRTLDLAHYLAWGVPNIISNIITMGLANVWTMVSTLDVVLPLFAFLGLGALIVHREREKGLMFVLPFVLVAGLFVSYTFITPFHTHGGSFKKSYQLLLPFWAVLGAFAIETYVRPQRVAVIVGILGAGLSGMSALQAMRADFDLARRFNESIIALDARLRELGDVNGDGEIIIMTQDPFILNYHGYRALMIPSDPLDMILEAAYRYRVDYILLPSARPALDGFLHERQQDPRLTWKVGIKSYELLAVLPAP